MQLRSVLLVSRSPPEVGAGLNTLSVSSGLNSFYWVLGLTIVGLTQGLEAILCATFPILAPQQVASFFLLCHLSLGDGWWKPSVPGLMQL